MIGAEALVPPNTFQPGPLLVNVSYTATPVTGSATADTSATLRPAQPASVWNLGFGMSLAQPEPVAPHANKPSEPVQLEFHTDSCQPAAVRVRVVPPTAVTCAEDAG